jgi:hypothetical protein
MPSHSRGAFRPSVARSCDPLRSKRAQGRPGAGIAPAVRCAKSTRKGTAQQHTGGAKSLGLPCAMVGRLMPCSPGSRTSFWPPSPRELTMPSARLGSRASSQRLDRSNDGQNHTVLPYAAHPAWPGGFAGLGRRSSARGYGLTGTTRPARTSRARRRRVHRRPGSQVVTTYDRPSRMSRDGRYIRQIRISVKWNIFTRRG